ncbi:MAG: HAMP domain-containing sensor histidine kinase [Patescibacteria group bacterium]
MKIINFVSKSNIKREAEDLGVSVWQTPSFLFLIMGIFIVIVMTVVYYLSRFYDSPEILIFSESAVVIVILSIGNVIIQSIEQIARANKIKSEFITIASHQLKTPLSQINWELEILLFKNKEGLTPKQLELINTIKQSHTTMTRLVNDLLDVARIDQGKFILNKEKINIIEIIDEIIDNNKVLAKASNVEINLIKPEKVPGILADKKRIGVAIDNLISNAIKYIEKKGLVEIKIKPDDKNIIVSVKDSGVGIPKNQQDKVFQKFFRSNNVVKYQTEGTGLGLFISKNIIEQSGGKIWFKSTEKEGSDFCFSLPIN